MDVCRAVRYALDAFSAVSAATVGVPSIYAPRVVPAWLWPPGSPNAISPYDTAPLRAALGRFVDFERRNAGPMRLSVGAVNIRTGNFTVFDTATDDIRADQVLAGAALPPMFSAVEIDGERYWDGGLVSNTPLQWVLEAEPHRDSLVFQVTRAGTIRRIWPG